MGVLPKPYLPWQALSAHLQLLHAALPSFEGAVLPALLALFHDNRALCAAAPRALIHDLVRMHCADRPPPLGGANATAARREVRGRPPAAHQGAPRTLIGTPYSHVPRAGAARVGKAHPWACLAQSVVMRRAARARVPACKARPKASGATPLGSAVHSPSSPVGTACAWGASVALGMAATPRPPPPLPAPWILVVWHALAVSAD